MLVPSKMRRANIFIPESDVEATAIELARLESFHIAPHHEEGWSQEESQWNDLVDDFLDLKRRTECLCFILGIDIPPSNPVQQVNLPIESESLEESLKSIEDDVLSIRNELNDVETNLDRLRLLSQEVQMLGPLDMPLEEIRNPTYLSWIVGTMPREELERLEIVLFRVPVVIIPLNFEEDRVLIIAASAKNYEDFLRRAMRNVFTEPLELPHDINGIPKDVLPELKKRLSSHKTKRYELKKKIEELRGKWSDRLGELWCGAVNNADISRAITRFDKHDSTYLISGWVLENRADDLINSIEDASEGRADVELSEPYAEARQKTPTKLRHNKILKPFESIVSIFGFPRYRESDPTLLVALSFTLMYGMMFGDVGHGLIIALIGLLLSRKSGGMGSSLGSVLMAAGLSGAAFGFLYGSIFGYEDILPTLWLNPLHDIVSLLIASVISGIVLLNIGFLIHLVTTAKTGRWLDFLFSENGLVGIALYWSLLGGGYAAVQGITPVWVFLLSLLVSACLFFLKDPFKRLMRKERPLTEEGWGNFSVQSFFELFEAVISAISNSLSFVRLGAFAVAHVGLMRVVFTLAETSDPIGRIIIIVIGTVIVIGLEGLIVAIQTLRLEYYEFFGKFFSGGGIPFKPFKLSDETCPH